MKNKLIMFFANVLFFIITPLTASEIDIKNAVVKIYTIKHDYNYYEPWQMRGQKSVNGSGIIIDNKRILTNAHVVANHTFIQVKKAGQPKKYVAKVEIVAHECDLAILKVINDDFFADVIPLKLGKLSKVRDKVAVYGFPKGGDELAITEGVVSRVEHQRYSHSNAYLLACQIDAAINPGSSGGAVIKGGKIIGVAFQGGGGENIGYMVPEPVITHFLEDIKDNNYDGIPELSISIQEMENPDLRAKYHMNKKQTGVLVNKIYPESAAMGKLNPEDIILSIDGKNVDNNGTTEFRRNERTFFGYIIQNKYIGDIIKLEILRNGKVSEVEIELKTPINLSRLVPYEQYDKAPTYYIIGGLVFEPLTLNFLKEWGNRKWRANSPVNLLNYYSYGEPTNDQRQIIVLVKVLADEINIGYHSMMHNVISTVNGKNISTMHDLVKAFEEHNGEYYTIEDEEGLKIILNKNKVDKTNQRILETYKINTDRSKNLLKN